MKFSEMISNQSTRGFAGEDVVVVGDAQADADAVGGEIVEAVCGHYVAPGLRRHFAFFCLWVCAEKKPKKEGFLTSRTPFGMTGVFCVRWLDSEDSSGAEARCLVCGMSELKF